MSQRPVNENATCYYCAFYFDAGYTGDCRRRAPIIGERGRGEFPETGHGGWCGDFQPRPERAPLPGGGGGDE